MTSEILKNDKTECVDGRLKLYSSGSYSKKTFIGDIDVQVKGTTAKKSSESPKRPVAVDDLRYYLDHGGALYFVVYVKENGAAVYFKELLPFDIRKLLRDHGEQKTVNLRFSPFPSDPTETLSLLTRIIRDKKAQRASTGFAFCSLEEYQENGFGFPSAQFTVNVGPGETLASLAPYKHGLYQYGVDEHGQSFPIDKIEDVSKIAIGTDAKVSSGEESFSTTLFFGEDKNDGNFLKFDGFIFNEETRTLRLDEAGSVAVMWPA